ncbi:hypothetical protein [Halorussus lipolyticus]|uniref:hypothetical protein n=1 Tax=Halorussus lipolyticus TaxID=3034024 RepID=UPI0023E81959|nr:hypothetical protein [Halorussus sp. DT80]
MTVAEDESAGDDLRTVGQTRFGMVAALLTGLGFVAVAGLPGLAAAALLGSAWVLGPTYAFVLGHVALAAVRPASLVALALLEVGLFAVLLAPAVTVENPAFPVAVTVAAAGVGGALSWASTGGESVVTTPVAAVLLVGAFSVATYWLDRSQRGRTSGQPDPGERTGRERDTDTESKSGTTEEDDTDE